MSEPHPHGESADAAPDHADHDSIQGSLEKSAKISGVIFTAPPTWLSYPAILGLSVLAGIFIRPNLSGILEGLALVGVPALLAGPLSAPIASALGGTFYYKRAAFLAAVGVAIVAAYLLLSIPLRLAFGLTVPNVLFVAYMGVAGVRHCVLFMTSDNRHSRSLPVSLLPAIFALPLILRAYPPSTHEWVLVVALPFVFLAPLVFFLHIFDAPLRRTLNVSASELFRYYLDHITSGRMDGEEILGRFSEPISAKFGAVAFRTRSAKAKAAIVVPALHPGPIGKLGGSDLPQKIAEALPDAGLVMVPHGSATHDYNPTSSKEVERFARGVREALAGAEWKAGGSRAVTSGTSVRVTSQLFAGSALLTYTAWPEPIDDVEYGVGLAAILNAQLAGARDATFVDCHNSLLPGSGAVFLCTPRADAILAASRDATRGALAAPVATLKVGVAQDKTSFTRAQGIGDQGVQALVVDAGGAKHAYVLWDGNNAVPAVVGEIGNALTGVVDSFQVMTTDNHSVNAIAGAYGPVGHRALPSEIAKATRRAVERALADLEPVECAFVTGTVDELRVYGNQKTVQLTSSINVMTSILVELLAATVAMQVLGTVVLFLLARSV
ncbi:MAG: DUF2070 family protein [Thermoplasmatota archaeon]